MIDWSQTDWIAELERCKWDVYRFARVFLGIKLHPGQRKMTEAYLRRNQSGWRAFYLWLMIAAGNRAGKTLALAIIIIHACVYRIGLEPPDQSDPYSVKRWGTVPFHWWHFAIEQGPAEQVFHEIATIFGGIHPAQKRGCPWAEAAGDGDATKGSLKLVTLTDTGIGPWCTGSKERGEYAWVKFSPELGGAEIHFRSTKAKALGSLGQNMHGVSFDEAGLESNLDFLMNEVLHFRRLGTGGQFILISTPSASTSTDFEDLWYTGDPEDPFRDKGRFSMRMSTRENIGYGINRAVFDDMIEGVDEQIIAQNIDGLFIQAAATWFSSTAVDAIFDDTLPADQPPRPGRVYVQSLDPGLKDKCWSLTFDILPNRTAVGVHIERIQGKQTTRNIVALGVRVHQAYEQKKRLRDESGLAWIETGVDTTALGGHMFRELLEESIPIKTVEFGGLSQIKRQLLSDLRSAIDEKRIRLPAEGDWVEARKQLRNYKLADRKIEQDLVMGLAIIVKLMRAAPLTADHVPAPFEYGVTTGEEQRTDGITAKTLRTRMADKRRRDRLMALTAHPAGE